MKAGLRAGDRPSVHFVVDESMAAAFEGKRIHNVLSTFHLVYYSELAARRLIEQYLDAGEEAAGSEICLKHISPTKIGDKVEVTASLRKIDGKRIVCEISAASSTGRICAGTQTQSLIRAGELDSQGA